MPADVVTCHNLSCDRHEKGRECDIFPFSICVTCHKPERSHKPEPPTACPSCGFSRLEPADDATPPHLVWTCSLAGDCRYLPRMKPDGDGKPRRRVAA